MAAKGVDKRGTKPVATNRTAWRDYDILETLECGLVLKGSEVKALREAKVQLNDAYARVRDGELWLTGMHIAAYSHGTGAFNHEIDHLGGRLFIEHLSALKRRLIKRKVQKRMRSGDWQLVPA